MTEESHCPYRQAKLLQQALASDKVRVAFLLGAGCPVSIRVSSGENGSKPLIPNIQGLTEEIDTRLRASETLKANYAALKQRLEQGASKAPNVEDILSHLRALQDVVRDGAIDGLNKASLAELDKVICEITTQVVGVSLPDTLTPYHQFATWVSGISRANAVEIFTPNYDLLLEQAFEAVKAPYFDGFIGSKEAFFDLASMETDALPTRWARLWKVHGSINWWRTKGDEVVRRENKSEGDRQMIYPSHLKYDQSRRMPYLAMLDRLRAFLARGQAVLVMNGYSFADQHLNEVILNGLRSNPTAICFALLFGARSNYGDIVKKARVHPNLSLLAADGAVLGTLERAWGSEDQPGHALHGISVKRTATAESNEKVEETKCEFLLGDFKQFGMFLAQQFARNEPKDEDQIEP
jgi:hypothetical protein